MQRRCLAIMLLATIVLTLCATSVALHASSRGSVVLYMYGMDTCPHCSALHKLLDETFGCKSVYFCNVRVCNECRERLLAIYRIIGLTPVVPLTLVICGNCVKAVVVGEVDSPKFWIELVKSNASLRVPVYAGTSLIEYLEFSNETALKRFTVSVAPELFNASGSSIVFEGRVVKLKSGANIIGTQLGETTSVIPLVIALALSDSINPCALYLYVVLLLAAALSAYSFTRSEPSALRNVVAVGLAFISAVYVGYVALGFGLLKALSMVPIYSRIAAAIAIGFGAWTIASGLARKSRILGKGFVFNYVPRAATSATLSFALGLLVTFTLLPCSAGPYVVFVSIARNLGLESFIPLVLLYNLVFVSPMIAILLAVASISKLEAVQRFIIENSDKLSVVSGILLVLIGIYVLLYQVG